MKKYLLPALIFTIILAFAISGCNNNENQIVNEKVNNAEEITNNRENNNNSNIDSANNGTTTDIEEIFPLYVQYLGTIADSINNTLVELETKDQYYFEQNPNDGIDLLYNIITDYKGYISVLDNLEYNSNPDINHLNSLFIDGLEENIRVFELSIDSLKQGSYDEVEYTNQLSVVQEKFDKFSKEYFIIAEKAGYSGD